MSRDGFEWDAAKAVANFRKHGIDFADAAIALEDPLAMTMQDPDSNGEVRLVSVGRDASGRLLVTVFAFRNEAIRIISSRPASSRERRAYEGM